MSISPLIPIASATIGPLVAKVVERLPDGVSFAEMLQKTIDANWGRQRVDGSNPVRSQGLAAKDALARFQHVLLTRFDEAGIDTSLQIHLRGDGLGGVVVENDHPNGAAIESIFAEDDALTSLFNELAESYVDLRERSSVVGFSTSNLDSLRLGTISRRGDAPLTEFGIVVEGEDVAIARR